jgi:cation transport ATPase
LRKLFLEGQRRIEEKKQRRDSKRRERALQDKIEEAAQAMAEEHENAVETPVSTSKFFRDNFERIQDKLHDFADNMYSDAGTAAEDAGGTYVPHTDLEEEQEERPRKLRQERKPRKTRTQAPDIPADELASRYRLGLRFMGQRLWYLAILAVVMLYLSIAGSQGLPLPAALLNEKLLAAVLTWCLALGTAIGLDVFWMGVSAALRGEAGMHTLSALAIIATLADGLYAATLGREGPAPFSAMALMSLFFAVLGAYQRKKALYLACRTAAGTAEPYRVTLDDNKWNGISSFAKEYGSSEGFGSQIQSTDGASRIYRIWSPVLMLAAVLCAVLASVGRGQPGLLTWCLSAILVAASPLAGLMAFGQPYLRLTRRLDRTGAVLAGWDGVESMTGKANVLIRDDDIFPEGTVIMKSIKQFNQISLEKMTGCIASMLRNAGSGLYHIFDTELRRLGGFYRPVDNLESYEAGGLTADIRGEQIVIGTYGFMNVMGIPVEQGYRIRNAVYCVINKQLSGVFALDYEMSHYDKESLTTLIRGGVSPVLVTRDFNVIPSMLKRLDDSIPVDQMEYPPIDRRRELSQQGQAHNPVLGALLTREGMGAYADAIIGARRLHTIVRLNAVLTILASLVGLVLAFYLTWVRAFESLTPLSMLVFLLIWAVPNVAISALVDQF